MLVAGSNSGHGMLVRLLGNGAKDASFAAPAVAAGMVAATALGTADDGSVVVAGRGELGVSGALIVRLQANGQLDSLFGSNGSTWIDLPSDSSSYRLDPTVHDIAVLPDGRVLLAGEDSHYGLNRPFVARLLGTGGGNGPGVLGIERHDFTVKEEDQNAVINVRRMGGRSGTVSVGYRTRTMPTNPSNATPGQDFTAVVGRLTWADGDASDKQIIVPIASGDSFEGPEYFSVGFDDLQGGAGLGIVTSTVQIAAGEGFLGFLTIDGRAAIVADEGGAYVELSVMYDAREPGAVSVKLQMGPEDAKAGSDFVADPITVSWPEGASGSKLVRIPIVDDNRHERRESFTVSLVDPTAGAVLAEPNKTTITIQDDDPESSGGGSFGFPSLLLLGAGVLLRRLWGRPRRSGALGGTPGVNFQPVAPRPGTRSGG
jgi:hypothetical protein